MFSFEQVWIGKSPRKTEYYNTYGPKFEGNTILFHIGNRKYMYVGESVKLFQTQSPIVHYVSPVGNNDVPYPYAVDDTGVYYLLSLGTGLKIKSKMMMEYDNPYELYYEEQEKKKKSFAVKPITFDVLVPRQ